MSPEQILKACTTLVRRYVINARQAPSYYNRKFKGELFYCDALRDALNVPSFGIETYDLHGTKSQVEFENPMSAVKNDTLRCELCDIMFLTYVPNRWDSCRVTYLQAKLQKSPIETLLPEVRAVQHQWLLLSQRPEFRWKRKAQGQYPCQFLCGPFATAGTYGTFVPRKDAPDVPDFVFGAASELVHNDPLIADEARRIKRFAFRKQPKPQLSTREFIGLASQRKSRNQGSSFLARLAKECCENSVETTVAPRLLSFLLYLGLGNIGKPIPTAAERRFLSQQLLECAGVNIGHPAMRTLGEAEIVSELRRSDVQGARRRTSASRGFRFAVLVNREKLQGFE